MLYLFSFDFVAALLDIGIYQMIPRKVEAYDVSIENAHH